MPNTLLDSGLGDVRIADRYVLREEMSRGGLARVFRARDEVLDREVAAQILHPDLATDPAFWERFRREARAAAGLAHPNIVAVYDWGEHEVGAFRILSLVDGVSLRDVLRARSRLTLAEALAVLVPAAAGLQAAHDAGVVHRDVKPENLLIGRDGTVRVTDFGLAQATTNFVPEVLVGSPQYHAPEALEGAPQEAPVDVYALGIMLFECLTGAPPNSSETLLATEVAPAERGMPATSSFGHDPNPALNAVFLAATARDPAQRISAAGFARQLRKAAGDDRPMLRDVSDAHQTERTTPHGAAELLACAAMSASTHPDTHDFKVPSPAEVRTREELGTVLTALRQRSGRSLRDLANTVFSSPSTLSGWCRADTLPYPSQYPTFAAMLGELGIDEPAPWLDLLNELRSVGATDSEEGEHRDEAQDVSASRQVPPESRGRPSTEALSRQEGQEHHGLTKRRRFVRFLSLTLLSTIPFLPLVLSDFARTFASGQAVRGALLLILLAAIAWVAPSRAETSEEVQSPDGRVASVGRSYSATLASGGLSLLRPPPDICEMGESEATPRQGDILRSGGLSLLRESAPKAGPEGRGY